MGNCITITASFPFLLWAPSQKSTPRSSVVQSLFSIMDMEPSFMVNSVMSFVKSALVSSAFVVSWAAFVVPASAPSAPLSFPPPHPCRAEAASTAAMPVTASILLIFLSFILVSPFLFIICLQPSGCRPAHASACFLCKFVSNRQAADLYTRQRASYLYSRPFVSLRRSKRLPLESSFVPALKKTP